MSRKELEFILDYILNKADSSEFEVIAKACARRSRDQSRFAGLGGEGPSAMAQRMSRELQSGVGASLDSIRELVRNYITEMIHKEAPEITEEQIAAYLEEVTPSREGGNPLAESGSEESQGPLQSNIPPDALLSMVTDFIDYSSGGMKPSKQQELWAMNPRWQDQYWASFPPQLKALVKAYLDGRIESETLGTALVSLLGL